MSQYYLCSEDVIKAFPQVKKSNPFKSGFEYDKEDDYYVAILDFEKVQSLYDNFETELIGYDIWCNECVSGMIDISKITLKECKEGGLFVAINNNLGLTNTSNRAIVIHELSIKYNCTPIQLINRISKFKK